MGEGQSGWTQVALGIYSSRYAASLSRKEAVFGESPRASIANSRTNFSRAAILESCSLIRSASFCISSFISFASLLGFCRAERYCRASTLPRSNFVYSLVLRAKHDGMMQVISRYLRAARDVAITVGIVAVIAHFLNQAKLPFLTEDFVRWLRVGTTSCFAVATLGRSGWEIQTWTATSPAEKLNTTLFRLLYLAAFALVALSFLIKPT